MDEEAFLRAFGFPALTWAPAYMGIPADKAEPRPVVKVVEEVREAP